MENASPSASRSVNPYLLPASILVAAVLVAGSIVYMVNAGGGAPKSKNFPVNAFSRCVDERTHAAVIQDDYNAAAAAGVNSTPTTFVNGVKVSDENGNSVGASGPHILAAIEAAVGSGKRAPVEGPLALTDRDIVLGSPDAPVTIVEYGDYQCSYCAVYFQQVEPAIRSQYVETGKAKFAFRNFQFLGPGSVAAAEAAECARDQGAFWEYHDALYAAKIASAEFGRELFLTIAQDLGLNEK